MYFPQINSAKISILISIIRVRCFITTHYFYSNTFVFQPVRFVLSVWCCPQQRTVIPHYLKSVTLTRRTTVKRTPLDECSAHRRDLHLTTHNTHNPQNSTWQHTTLTTHSNPQPHQTTATAPRPQTARPLVPAVLFMLLHLSPNIRLVTIVDCDSGVLTLPGFCDMTLRHWIVCTKCFETWHFIGYSVPNVFRQVKGPWSSADDCTMTQRHILEEQKILCICVHKVSFGVQ
jgi:hypothetical protein